MAEQALWPLAAPGLVATLACAVGVWGLSVWRRDASLADRFWPLFVGAGPITYAALAAAPGVRGVTMLALLLLWGVRLSAYITWRNWGHGEDRRYAALRERAGAAFAWRSLLTVFGLQGVLAWIVGAPVLAGLALAGPFGVVDLISAALALFGIAFEAVADQQMAHFRRDPAQRGRVMQQGLWAYSRHPNYFGEACVWWGLGLMGAAAGAWWSLVSPLLMSVLLLRVSGVSLLEKDIAERRPAYRDYIRRTNAFFPGRRRNGGVS